MINVTTLESIFTLFVAYLVVITISGYVPALIAKKFGDHTPEYAGLLSLNPIDHIDPVGLICLLLPFIRIGWGKHVPINPYFIESPYRRLKIVVTFLSEAFTNFLIALVASVLFLKLFGVEIYELTMPRIVYDKVLISDLACYYPAKSSFMLVVGIILVSMVYLSVLLTVLNLIVGGFRLIIMFFLHDTIFSDNFSIFIILMLLISFLLRLLSIYFIIGIGEFAKLLAGVIN